MLNSKAVKQRIFPRRWRKVQVLFLWCCLLQSQANCFAIPMNTFPRELSSPVQQQFYGEQMLKLLKTIEDTSRLIADGGRHSMAQPETQDDQLNQSLRSEQRPRQSDSDLESLTRIQQAVGCKIGRYDCEPTQARVLARVGDPSRITGSNGPRSTGGHIAQSLTQSINVLNSLVRERNQRHNRMANLAKAEKLLAEIGR